MLSRSRKPPTLGTHAQSVLLLGLLAACTHGAAMPTGGHASKSEREVIDASASYRAAAVPPKGADEPVAGGHRTLLLNADAWDRGSLLGGAGTGQTTTRGGNPRLNRMADELRVLAADRDRGADPIALVVADDVSGWQVLSALSILAVAGFRNVVISHAGTTLRFTLGSSSATGRLLRVLKTGAQLAKASDAAPTSDLSKLCEGSECRGATLSVAADAPLSSWWQAARQVSAGAHSVVVVLDALPRQHASSEPRGPIIKPIGRIAAEEVSQRVMAEYGALYACLSQFPVSNGPAEHLSFELRIEADGTTKSALARGESRDPGLVSCLSEAFKRMVFPPPNSSSAKVLFPFALGE